MAKRMVARRFVDNGTGRIFSNKGLGLNGHHTHAAMLEAGEIDPTVTFPANYAWGLPDSVVTTIDTDVNRTPSDLVGYLDLGFNDNTSVADCARFLARIEAATTGKVQPFTMLPMDNDDLEIFIWDHQAQLKAADLFVSGLKRKGVKAPLLMTLHVLASNVPGINSFLESLATGLNLSEGEPVTAFRNLVILGRKGVKKLNTGKLIAFGIVAINLFSESATVLDLGKTPKYFPSVKLKAMKVAK
jgi:hypothetical protein